MKKNTQPLAPDTYYHLYNRGIDSQPIFREKRNYNFFMRKYLRYIHPIAKTYAFCLLRNHFHFFICIRSEETLKQLIPNGKFYSLEKFISLQFSHLFNSYVQAINKRFLRTGGLFETPFRRIAIEDEQYLIQLIAYIHLNPFKHGYSNDYINYPYSSFHLLLEGNNKILESKTVMDWFGGSELFKKFHDNWSTKLEIDSKFTFD